MLIFDMNNDVILLDNIYAPVVSDHFWVLDLNMMDYTLAPLLTLEETVCPSIEMLIDGFKFILPAKWNVLVVDPDTMQLDCVEAGEIAGRQFNAFVYGPGLSRFKCKPINVTDYINLQQNVGPTIAKHQMLCHPISAQQWISVAPSDSYNKYLKNIIAGDLI